MCTYASLLASTEHFVRTTDVTEIHVARNYFGEEQVLKSASRLL